MKKKLILLGVVSSLAIVSIPSFFAISLFCFSSPYKNVFSSVLKDKIELLEKHKDDEKIILIGNSSIPFGIRSDLMEKYLSKYKVIDFGLYGSLGTKVMIDLSRNYISKNDLVILAPEQNYQSQSLYFSGKDYLMAVDDKLNYVSLLESSDKKKVLGDLPSFISHRLQYTITNATPKIDGIYSRDSFNDYYDISSTLCEYNILQNNYDELNLIDLSSELYSPDYIDYVNKFNDFVLSKGAKLYYAYSPTNPLCIRSEHLLDEYQLKLIDKLDFPVINSLKDVMLDPLYFYDTNFHLNNTGAIINTKRLIQSIKLVLNDTTITDIIEPRPPLKPSEEIKDGDNNCLDLFNYTEEYGTYKIVSLSQKGLNAKEIIIPFKYKDTIIRSFDRGTFLNSNSLEKITIQENISYLSDGSFSGANNLKEVIINHNKPSNIRVGRYLLEGANPSIKLYVKKDVLHTFKLDYSWSQYADYIFPLD